MTECISPGAEQFDWVCVRGEFFKDTCISFDCKLLIRAYFLQKGQLHHSVTSYLQRQKSENPYMNCISFLFTSILFLSH